eukprot:132513-Pleurochrysis_carterae.AAC.3
MSSTDAVSDPASFVRALCLPAPPLEHQELYSVLIGQKQERWIKCSSPRGAHRMRHAWRDAQKRNKNTFANTKSKRIRPNRTREGLY